MAVDPSSPFSHGAILGDRIRMQDLTSDPGVFMRSMASRGSLGGLSEMASGVADVMDAAGYDIVLVETVGAGQDEVEVATATQTTVLGSTYVPGLLNPDIVMRVDLKNGKGKASYKTPAGGEGSGVVAEAIAIPYVVDPDGNRFAVSGSRDKPAN